MMKLSTITTDESVVICRIEGSGAFRSRLSEMGFVKGKKVRLLYKSPGGTPIVFEILGSQVALRKDEAEKIIVEHDSTDNECEQEYTSSQYEQTDTPAEENGHTAHHIKNDYVTIALVGNPNCGKTSLFNAASGGHERTGNYSGVTVSSVIGEFVFKGRKIKLIDLPGTYSLRAFSPEEAYVSHELEKGEIDAVINVLDVNNLERNLLLTLQLKERNLPIVGALNMYDEFEESKSVIDIKELSRRLGLPLQPTVARNKHGIDELIDKAVVLADEHIALHKKGVKGHMHEAPCCHNHSECRNVKSGDQHNCLCHEREENDMQRYARISSILKGIYEKKEGKAQRVTHVLDKFMAARWIAYPLFLILMWFIFWCTFTIGQYPMDWIDSAIASLSAFIESNMGEGMLRDLICEGIIGGVGSVIVFLPNILILYLLITILEDSGYLARAAMLADPMLNKMGLHGKSFIPLLMGFGCNVPAVMASRTIESSKSRLLTMLVTPLMSCSARIPVYVVFAGAFFASNASTVMLGLYLSGTIMALLVAWVLSKAVMRKQESHFIMELPPYRLPNYRSVLRHTWEKGRQYLHKMGGIILIASIVVWALGYFPNNNDTDISESERQEMSYMGQIGHAIEPVIEPLGYDWRMGVGIMAGVGAKELMVSTLGVLYNCDEEDTAVEGAEDASQTRLAQLLTQHTTPEAALSYMVFALLYFPCIATIAAIKAESSSWKWALFAAGYTTVLAYVMAFAVYRIALIL